MAAKFGQQDFSAGAFRSVARHLIPPNGAYSLQNFLLDEEDGSPWKRGGSEYLSTSAFGSALTWVWDGLLVGGRRTVLANGNDFGVLDAAEAPVNLGGAGLAAPVPFAVLGGVLYIGGGTIYAGSRKAADYSTGTVSVTNGSRTVTGAGTLWAANADGGMLLQRGAGTRYYAVQSVDSNTQVTLVDPYEGVTAAAQAYTLTRLGSAGAPYRLADIYATAGTRLLTGEGRRVYESAAWASGVFRPHSFDVDLYHEMPGGAELLGITGMDEDAVVFTTAGVYVIGNLPFDPLDDVGNQQQTVRPLSEDIILWGPAGVASWQEALIVPAVDGVWLVGQGEAPRKLSHSITPLYFDHVRAGHTPGQAVVYRGHLFLPVLNAAHAVVDQLVCRLDRPIEVRNQVIFPWTWQRGHGAEVPSLAVRVGGAAAARQPKLLAAGEDGRVLDCSGFFEPAASNSTDADGTAPTYLIETRDFETGGGIVNTVTALKIRYELEDAGTDDPEIVGYVSKGARVEGLTEWGVGEWGEDDWSDATLAEFFPLSGRAGESTGRDVHNWWFAAAGRYVRARLVSSDPAARMVLRSLVWEVEEHGDWE